MKITDLFVENTFSKIKNGKLDIPSYINQIRIDVGLNVGINAAKWLADRPDRFVIGIEPLQYHWDLVQEFKSEEENGGFPYSDKFFLQLKKNKVEYLHQDICDIKDRFCGIFAAIDDVKTITTKDFYVFSPLGARSGGSSLLTPTRQHPNDGFLDDVEKVYACSLEQVLDLIPWDRFPYIEHIKTDCEGHDPIVTRSIGKYLNRIVYITSENHCDKNHFFSKHMQEHWFGDMRSYGFEVIYNRFSEVKFVNSSLRQSIAADLDNWTYMN